MKEREELALLRIGLAEKDIQKPILNELRLIFSADVAEAKYEAKLAQYERNINAYEESLNSVNSGISYAEYVLIGEPIELLHLVEDKISFEEKFKEVEHESKLTPIVSRKQFTKEEENEYKLEKMQEFTRNMKQYELEREAVESERLEKLESFKERNEKSMSTVREEFKTEQELQHYDGKQTVDSLQRAQLNRDELLQQNRLKYLNNLTLTREKINNMKEFVEEAETEYRKEKTENYNKILKQEIKCSEVITAELEERSKKEKELNKYRLDVKEQAIEREREYEEEKIEDALQIEKLHNEQVCEYNEEKRTEMEEREQELNEEILLKRQQKEMFEEEEEQLLKKRNTQYEEKQELAEKILQQRREEIEEEIINTCNNLEECEQQAVQKERVAEYEEKLEGINLIADKSKFLRINE